MPPTLTWHDPYATGAGSAPILPVPALVLLFSHAEPARIGECLLPPEGDDSGPFLFGREADAPGAHLRPHRQRPGASAARPPLSCPQISALQLSLTPLDGVEALIENVGRCPLLVNGHPTDLTTLQPGDLVELKGQLLFLYALRPPVFPALPPEAPYPDFPFGEADPFGMVGESPAAWALRRSLALTAHLESHGLILGATGVGKEHAARAIHGLSKRGERPLVSVNAASLGGALTDYKLVGNVKDSPNPGTPASPGLVGQAEGSTLFLDEIGELGSEAQAHLLRILDPGGEYVPIGETTPRRADVRVLGATNRAPDALKHDLTPRLKAQVLVPDLNERPEDVPLLLRHLMIQRSQRWPALAARFFAGGSAEGAPRMAPQLVRALVGRTFSANVRELDLLLEGSLRESLEAGRTFVAPSGALRAGSPRPKEATPQTSRRTRSEGDPDGDACAGLPPALRTLRLSIFSAEERRRLRILGGHDWNVRACAQDPVYPARSPMTVTKYRDLYIQRALSACGGEMEAAGRILTGGERRPQPEDRLWALLERLRRQV